jgi:hypothetical protein
LRQQHSLTDISCIDISHGGKDDDIGLLGRNAVWACRYIPSFMRGRTMAQAVSRRHLTANSRVHALVRMGFVVVKMAPGEVFLRVF